MGLDFNPNHLTVGDALLNVLMMNKVIGNVSIDPSYWTLTYEVLFYAGAAMIFFGLKIKRIEWPCLAWLGLAFVARVSSFNQHHHTPWGSAGRGFLPFFRPGHDDLSDLSAAQFLAHHVDDDSRFCDDPVWAFFNPGAIKLWQFMLMTALFAIVVWLVAERKLDFLNVAPLLFLGEISYSLYLVHQIAGYWVIRQLEGADWDPDYAIWAAVLCAVAVATGVRKWVEVPAQKAIRGWYQETGKKQYVLSSSPS